MRAWRIIWDVWEVHGIASVVARCQRRIDRPLEGSHPEARGPRNSIAFFAPMSRRMLWTGLPQNAIEFANIGGSGWMRPSLVRLFFDVIDHLSRGCAMCRWTRNGAFWRWERVFYVDTLGTQKNNILFHSLVTDSTKEMSPYGCIFHSTWAIVRNTGVHRNREAIDTV